MFLRPSNATSSLKSDSWVLASVHDLSEYSLQSNKWSFTNERKTQKKGRVLQHNFESDPPQKLNWSCKQRITWHVTYTWLTHNYSGWVSPVRRLALACYGRAIIHQTLVLLFGGKRPLFKQQPGPKWLSTNSERCGGKHTNLVKYSINWHWCQDLEILL